ncbi:MAG: AraC family transcriptional regulator N-terminal domain-containing protein [Acidimicrobiales bacterium]
MLEADPSASPRIRTASAPPGLGVADTGWDLLDAVISMLALLDAPSDRAVLAPMFEREIVWRLLTGPLRSSVRRIEHADEFYAPAPS